MAQLAEKKPRTKKIITEEVVETAEGPGEAERSELDDYLEGVSEAAEIKIYRVIGSKQKWIENVTSVESVREENLLESYGPGRYLIRPKKPNGRGWMPSRTVEIEGNMPREAPVQYLPPPDNGNERLFLMMQESAQRTHEMMLAMISSMGGGNRVPAADPSMIVTSMISGMASLKQMQGGGGDEIDRITKIIELSERIGGDRGPKGTVEQIIDMAKDVLPAIMAARSMRPEPVQVREAEPISSGSNPPPAEPPKAIAAVPGDPLKDEVLKLWLKLEAAARASQDADGWALSLFDLDEIGDKAASVLIDSILAAASFEDWQKGTGAIDSGSVKWFNGLFDAVKAGEDKVDDKEIQSAKNSASLDDPEAGTDGTGS